ncbi:hypothetical protein GW537_08195 [Piscirickettsia salmonis]|uniref:hypothetical protein n=1 Tax=Piscirickettsia salmonis TaxID=1238 RepID=UPI00137C17B2|nr:hypothetical protein [Piscirickettsia salmonis]QHS29096.1 hypothetical protein GW537_08195 [Piscirickettsia salmonis]
MNQQKQQDQKAQWQFHRANTQGQERFLCVEAKELPGLQYQKKQDIENDTNHLMIVSCRVPHNTQTPVLNIKKYFTNLIYAASINQAFFLS